MEISITAIKDDVKRHLSIIGKRLYDKEGKNVFSNITTSTVEEPIFDKYISAAVKEVNSALLPIIVDHDLTSNYIDYTLVNTRGKYGEVGFESHCEGYIKSYIVLFVVGRFLAMTHPDLAEKYTTDSSSAMLSLVQYAFYKEPPAAITFTYADVTGRVTDFPPDDKGELIATYTADHDCSEDGGGDLPHHNGTNVFLIPCVYDDNRIYTLEYSGDDTTFYYTIGVPDGMGGYNYPATERSSTMEGFSELIHTNTDDDRALLIWLDNKSAGTNTIKVYRK